MYGLCVRCKKPTNDMDLSAGGEPVCAPCKRERLGREPRELTEEECRERLLRHIWGLIEYWLSEDRHPDARGKLEGLAFSILSLLDGSSVGIPGFIVAPVGHSDDAEYCRKNSEDWWPHNGDKEQEAVKCDLGGSLHEFFRKFGPKSQVDLAHKR